MLRPLVNRFLPEPDISGRLTDALASVPWRPRINSIDRDDWGTTRTLAIYTEHPPGPPPQTTARLVYDVPKVFGYYSHLARWVVEDHVTVTVGDPIQILPPLPFGVGLTTIPRNGKRQVPAV